MIFGERLGLRLFLEGIEVEVIGAKVTTGIGRLAEASIQIPSADEIHDLLPRTLVHLFFWEGEGTKPGFEEPFKDNNSWKLLFFGEVVSYQYVKTDGMRHVVLQCLDTGSYWNAAKLYWGNGKTSLRHYKQNIFMGANTLSRGKKVVDSSGDLLRLINSKPTTIPTLTGLMGGIVHLLESIGGVYSSVQDEKKFRGVNDFFSQAELRLKLSRTIGVASRDTTSAQFFNEKSFRRYLRRLTRQTKATASMRQLMDLLLQTIHHNYVSIACPPYFPEGAKVAATVLVPAGTGVSPKTKTKLQQKVAQLEKVKDIVDGRLDSVRKDPVRTKQGLRDLALYKPSVNEDGTVAGLVVGESSNFDPQLDTDNHKSFSSDISTTGFVNKNAELSTKELEQSVSDLNEDTSKSVKSVRHRLVEGYVKARDAETTLRAVVNANTDGDYTEHTEDNLLMASRQLDSAIKSFKKGKFRPRYKRKNIEVALEDRLITHIFRPDIYMVPPPSCNVIFPDQYSYITFSRMWLRETTRLQLHGRNQWGRVLKKTYYAPNGEIISGPSRNDAQRAAKKGHSYLMEHEKFTGIIPAIEAVGSMELLQSINKKTEKSNGTSPWGANRHMLRAATYFYFKYRYMNRPLQIQGPFNPNVVAGMPGLVLDPIITPGGAASKELEGVHYVGMIDAVVHSIDQSGTMTSMSWSHCRPYDEALLPEDDALVNRRKISSRVVRRRPYKKKLEPPKDKGYWALEYLGTKSGGDPIAGYNLSEATRGEPLKEAMQLQLDFAGQGSGYQEVFDPNTKFIAVPKVKTTVRIDQNQVPVNDGTGPVADFTNYNSGVAVPGGDVKKSFNLTAPEDWMGRSITTDGPVAAGDSQNTVVSGIEVEIHQVGIKTTRKQITSYDSIPFEDATRPPWFSSIYLNSNIGNQFYQELLGCGSIVDSRVIVLESDIRGRVLNKEIEFENDSTEVELVQEITKDDGTIAKEVVSVPAKVISGSTVFDSVEGIATVYKELVESTDVSTRKFIKALTARKMASMVEVFGKNPSQVLELYKFVTDNDVISDTQDGGFHSGAFGNLDNLEGLDHVELHRSNNRGSRRKIDPRVDPRKERYQAVLRYREKLDRSKGQKG